MLMFGWLKKYKKELVEVKLAPKFIESDLRDLIKKELFNSKIQKKIITKAARESAEDQKKLVSRYHSLRTTH